MIPPSADAPSGSELDGVMEHPPSARLPGLGWSRILAAVAATLVAAAVVLGAIARHEPAFYRDRVEPPDIAAPTQEQAARRLMSDLAALHAAVRREGRWEAALLERDINAWLAVDLPRNHGVLLPNVATAPRIRIAPGRLDVGIRLGRWGVSTVAWATIDLHLRGPNQLAIEIADAGLGALPLPRGPVLAEVRRRIAGAGLTTSSVRLDGRSVLVVYISEAAAPDGPTLVLDAFSLGEGTIAFSGRTIVGRATDAGNTAP
jgi:hypothetical protein